METIYEKLWNIFFSVLHNLICRFGFYFFFFFFCQIENIDLEIERVRKSKWAEGSTSIWLYTIVSNRFE